MVHASVVQTSERQTGRSDDRPRRPRRAVPRAARRAPIVRPSDRSMGRSTSGDSRETPRRRPRSRATDRARSTGRSWDGIGACRGVDGARESATTTTTRRRELDEREEERKRKREIHRAFLRPSSIYARTRRHHDASSIVVGSERPASALTEKVSTRAADGRSTEGEERRGERS